MAERKWWSRRWLMALQDLGIDTNTSLRGSRVQQLEITRGVIIAQVQDRELGACHVEVRLLPLGNQDWAQVIDALSEHTLFAAQLSAGHVPPEIEQAFAQVGLSLLPSGLHELRGLCSCCPPEVDHCRPLLAVYRALAEMFDDDPWLLLQLRGRDRQQLLSALQERRQRIDRRTSQDGLAHRGRTPSRVDQPFFYSPHHTSPTQENTTSLLDDLDSFWGRPRLLNEIHHHIAPPPVDLALLRRLGPPPFAHGSSQVYDQLAAIYHQVSEAALALAFTSAEGPILSSDTHDPNVT